MRDAMQPVDFCSLLTPAEAGRVLHAALEPGRHPIPNDPSYCRWSEQGASVPMATGVDLIACPLSAFDDEKRRPADGATVVPVPGVGDDAFYEVAANGTPELYVRRRERAFVVALRAARVHAKDLAAMERALARMVLARL